MKNCDENCDLLMSSIVSTLHLYVAPNYPIALKNFKYFSKSDQFIFECAIILGKAIGRTITADVPFFTRLLYSFKFRKDIVRVKKPSKRCVIADVQEIKDALIRAFNEKGLELTKENFEEAYEIYKGFKNEI